MKIAFLIGCANNFMFFEVVLDEGNACDFDSILRLQVTNGTNAKNIQ